MPSQIRYAAPISRSQSNQKPAIFDDRRKADNDDAHHHREAELRARDIQEAGAGAVAQRIGDDHRHRRTRHDHQHNAGEDIGQIEFKRHRHAPARISSATRLDGVGDGHNAPRDIGMHALDHAAVELHHALVAVFRQIETPR